MFTLSPVHTLDPHCGQIHRENCRKAITYARFYMLLRQYGCYGCEAVSEAVSEIIPSTLCTEGTAICSGVRTIVDINDCPYSIS